MTLFTLEQAEAMLEQVREQILAMQRCKRQLDTLRGELVAVTEKTSGNGHVQHEDGLAERRRRAEGLAHEINEALARINGWGIEVKSISDGLVDRPSDRDGPVVYLCWRSERSASAGGTRRILDSPAASRSNASPCPSSKRL